MSFPSERDAARHLAFLQDIQRLLDEGQFVASYKFALLLTIAELCIEREPAADETLLLSLRDLSERMIELYWPQVAPFRRGEVLHQNQGRPAAILTNIASARQRAPSLAAARRSPAWEPLVNRVSKHVKLMPLWRLQMIGGSISTFLFEHELVYEAVGESIRLKPGVAHSFRALNAVVIALVQMAWIRYLHRVPMNHDIIGADADLASFLFGSERNALIALREPLRELQRARCFYCDAGLAGGGDIDHFVPWSRYPRDLGHNLVLVHARCNAAKSDMLADVPHLAAWSRRNAREREALSHIFQSVKVVHDETTTRRVAAWAYENTARAKGLVWLAGSAESRTLGPGWRDYL
jgi:5-methylcytosine-specific restriction endonuclease McrA